MIRVSWSAFIRSPNVLLSYSGLGYATAERSVGTQYTVYAPGFDLLQVVATDALHRCAGERLVGRLCITETLKTPVLLY